MGGKKGREENKAYVVVSVLNRVTMRKRKKECECGGIKNECAKWLRLLQLLQLFSQSVEEKKKTYKRECFVERMDENLVRSRRRREK